jgi:hypothetical protein
MKTEIDISNENLINILNRLFKAMSDYSNTENFEHNSKSIKSKLIYKNLRKQTQCLTYKDNFRLEVLLHFCTHIKSYKSIN